MGIPIVDDYPVQDMLIVSGIGNNGFGGHNDIPMVGHNLVQDVLVEPERRSMDLEGKDKD